MTNISQYDTTAGNNDSAPPNGAPEGMAPGKVNDTMREMMARMAKQHQDQDGSLVTGGTGNAYTLSTNGNYGALGDIPLLTFRADRANTGTVTLAVDGLTAKSVRKRGGQTLVSGEIQANQVVRVNYNSNQDRFELASPTGASASGRDVVLDVGTKTVFYQASAPTGWTQDTSVNDQVLKVVSGAGGGTGGSWTISGLNVQGHALSESQLPNISGRAHFRRLNIGSDIVSNTTGPFSAATVGGFADNAAIENTGSLNSRTRLEIDFGGSQSHDHGLSADGNWRPSHIDVIVASLD